MRPGRNEPCHCGSGRKYKNCHLKIDDAPLERRYEVAQQIYAQNWPSTAKTHYQARHYHWMAERLKPFEPQRILDIGCGSGHGLLALFEVLGQDAQILSLDENGACLNVAANTLAEAGVGTQIVKRLKSALTPEGFVLNAAPLDGAIGEECTLIEADVCNDPALLQTLIDDTPFDAVTIWLTGTHMMRQFHRDVKSRNIGSDGAHRLYVQNSVYELADRVLKSGGVLQVVDRTEAPTTDEMRDDFLNAHREQASVTNLEVTTLDYHIYDALPTPRTPMVFTPGTSGRIPDHIQYAITSIISLKP